MTIKLCYTVGKAGDFYESERPTHRTYSGVSVVLSLQCKDRADGSNDGKGFRRLFYCVVCQNTGCRLDECAGTNSACSSISTWRNRRAQILRPSTVMTFRSRSQSLPGSPALQKSYWGAPAYIAATSGVADADRKTHADCPESGYLYHPGCSS